ADVQALGGGEHVEDADALVAAGVPAERQAAGGVERGDALAADGALAGAVAAEGVVGPAEVAADVDGGVGDLHGVAGVAARVVDPGGLLAAAGRGALPAGVGVAQLGRAAVGARGRHDEELAVGREVDVAHVGVERLGALVAAAGGVPAGELRLLAGAVDHDDLAPGGAVDRAEVGGADELGPGGADVHLVELGDAAARLGPGELQVEEVVARTGLRVQRREGGPGRAADRVEGAGDVQPAADEAQVADPGAELRVERGDRGAGLGVEPGEDEVAVAVDLAEVAADVEGLPVRGGQQRAGLALVEVRREVRVGRAGRGVEGEQAVAGQRRLAAAGLLDPGERAADVDPVADLDDRLDRAVQDLGRVVGRVVTDHAPVV